VVVLSTLIFSAFALAQSEFSGDGGPQRPPKLGISDEKITVERDDDVLTLYWSGWINVDKPSDAPVTLAVRSTVEPAGKWTTRPRNRVLSNSFERGVNSSFHKFDLATMQLDGDSNERAIPPASELFEQNQTANLRVSLRQQLSAQGTPTLEEREYRLSLQGYALMSAARSGDVEEVRALLGKGARPDSANLQGWSALMIACNAGQLEVARLLVQNDVNLAAKTTGFAFSESANGSPIPRGATPLFVAAYAGQPDIVQLLVESGATYGDYVRRVQEKGANDEDIVALLSDTGPQRQEVIDRLVKQGVDRKDIEALIHRGGFADIVWRVSKRGVTYAGIAEQLKQSGASDEVIASRLRKRGATDEDIRKALSGKWMTGDAIRQVLLDKGANAEELGSLLDERKLGTDAVSACLQAKGATPDEIESVIHDGTVDEVAVRTLLRDKGIASEDAESCLTDKGAQPAKIVRFLTQHGGSVDALRADKWSPLMAACYSGSPRVVNLLLQEGANAHMADRMGYSALALAEVNGNTRVAKLLKAHGATLDVPWNPFINR
jgi:ankyrin repeat protein